MKLVFRALVILFSASIALPQTVVLGSHKAKYAPDGSLLPWTSWKDTVTREMEWYLKCPIEHGYPRFVFTTFMDGNYQPEAKRPSFIPSMQDGMGIISYLEYYRFTGRSNSQVLKFARYMGDYLVKESLTPDTGKYPRFTRSTGARAQFPLPPDSGSQDDRPYEIQPDKGGIAGYALGLLYDETHEKRYLEQALQNGRVLVANMRAGDAEHSPWPFRADFRTGEPRGEISGNMAFNLRLFDWLIASGYPEFQRPRTLLWAWVKDYQIPTAGQDGRLFAEFFEDHHSQRNRTAWAPLALARYLAERKQAIDPEWKQHAKLLIEFVGTTFTSIHQGVALCGEQDEDRDPWGGINTNYGATLAVYAAAAGAPEYKRVAQQALTFSLYAVDDDGCPRDSVLKGNRGGWQEDAHTDKIHNIIEAMRAFPEWAN